MRNSQEQCLEQCLADRCSRKLSTRDSKRVVN